MLTPALLVTVAAAALSPTPERRMLDAVAAGEKLWAESCRSPSADGSCLATAKPKTGPLKRCEGAASPSLPLVVARDRRKAKEALGRFEAALALWNRGAVLKEIDGDDAEARKAEVSRAAATALFRKAEGIYEEFRAVSYPEDLDLRQPPAPRRNAAEMGMIGILKEGGDAPSFYAPTPAPEPERPETKAEAREQAAAEKRLARSKRKMTDYVVRKDNLKNEARDAYIKVLEAGVAPWDTAAAARFGQMLEDEADQLLTAPLPLDFQKGTDEMVRAAFCGTMKDRAEPLQISAADVFQKCLDAAHRHPEGAAGNWPALCQRELDRLKPPAPAAPR